MRRAFLNFIAVLYAQVALAGSFDFVLNPLACFHSHQPLVLSNALIALEEFNLTSKVPLRVYILCSPAAETEPWEQEKFSLMKKLGFWVQGPEDFKGESDLFYIREDVLSKGSYDYWLLHLWPHEQRHQLQATNNPELAQMMWLVPGEKQSVYGAFMEAYADYGFNSTKAYMAEVRFSTLLSVVDDFSLIQKAGEGDVVAYERLKKIYDVLAPFTEAGQTHIDFSTLFSPHPQ